MSWPKKPAKRNRIFRVLRERDGDACQICRQPMDFALRRTMRPWAPSIDHFVPVSAGGSNAVGNLRLTHLRCNTKRETDGWLPAQDGAS